MLPKLTATNKNTEEKKDCLYPSCLRDGGARTCEKGEKGEKGEELFLSHNGRQDGSGPVLWFLATRS